MHSLYFVVFLISGTCGNMVNIINEMCTMGEEEVFSNVDKISSNYTEFRLYTRRNPENYQLIKDSHSIKASNYNPKVKTIFIVHGLQSTVNLDKYLVYYSIVRVVEMAEIIFRIHSEMKHGVLPLKAGSVKQNLSYLCDFNVIMVDWSQGAATKVIYAIRNAFAVATRMANFITILTQTTGTDLSKIHLIGLSLGGQLVSFVGKQLQGIGRITGLDPGGLCFLNYSIKHRLHFTDAKFVDVITTNGNGYGMYEPSGHVNHRVNDGTIQTECGDQTIRNYHSNPSTMELFVDDCSHDRAIWYYASTIMENGCTPVGYSCPDYESFVRGECAECGEDGTKCAIMGYGATEYESRIGNEKRWFYLNASSQFPYCLHHYHVSIKLKSLKESTNQYGRLFITLIGNHLHTLKPLSSYPEEFQPNKTYQYLITTPVDLGPLRSAKLLWINTKTSTDHNYHLYIDHVKIYPMNNLQRRKSVITTTFKVRPDIPLSPGVSVALKKRIAILM